MRRRRGAASLLLAAAPLMLVLLLLLRPPPLATAQVLTSIYATEPRRVLSAQPGAAGCLQCLVAASGRLLCWRTYFAGGVFWQAPPAGVGAARFVSVHVAMTRIFALLDNGGVAVGFFAAAGCPASAAVIVWGYLAGPFTELVGFEVALDQCAIRGSDGNIVCFSWAANPPSGAPALPASGGFLNLTAAVAPSTLCGSSCATVGGPFRGLVAMSSTPLDDDLFPFSIVGICAIRAVDSLVFCVIAQGPPDFAAASFLPDILPLAAFAGRPVARVRSAVGEMNDLFLGYQYGSFVVAVPFAPSPTTVIVSISSYGENSAGTYAVSSAAGVSALVDGTDTAALLQGMSPALDALNITDIAERPMQYPLFFTAQGQVCGAAGPSGTSRDWAPAWLPTCDNSGYVAAASGNFQNLCFLTAASSV
jgi:hypothetical protein